jgi:hypothetical protein
VLGDPYDGCDPIEVAFTLILLLDEVTAVAYVDVVFFVVFFFFSLGASIVAPANLRKSKLHLF